MTETVNRQQKMVEILELTHAMHESAGKQEWDRLVEYEMKRRGIIEELFQGGEIPSDDVDAIGKGIEEILRIDEQIMHMGKTGRDAIAEELVSITKKHSVSSAYEANK